MKRQAAPTFRPEPGWLARQIEAARERADAMPAWKTNPPAAAIRPATGPEAGVVAHPASGSERTSLASFATAHVASPCACSDAKGARTE